MFVLDLEDMSTESVANDFKSMKQLPKTLWNWQL